MLRFPLWSLSLSLGYVSQMKQTLGNQFLPSVLRLGLIFLNHTQNLVVINMSETIFFMFVHLPLLLYSTTDWMLPLKY